MKMNPNTQIDTYTCSERILNNNMKCVECHDNTGKYGVIFWFDRLDQIKVGDQVTIETSEAGQRIIQTQQDESSIN